MQVPARPRHRASGTSMIELAIVIAITGIIAILSIPNLQAWVAKMRTKAAGEHLSRSISVSRRVALAQRQRHCVQFGADSAFDNNDDSTYLLSITVSQEDAPNSGVWLPAPDVDVAGWTNSVSSPLYRGVSLEGGSDTTAFGGTDGCAGLLFNAQGYLDNPISEFATECGGAYCAMLTIRNKSANPMERRTLWVDRGGNVRVTVDPASPPLPPSTAI